MLSPMFTAGIVLLFVGLFLSRYLAERDLKFLSSDEKVKLLDAFSRFRAFGSLPLILIVLSFVGIGYLPTAWAWAAYFGVWLLVGIYFFWMHRLVFRRMRELGINSEYMSRHNRVRLVSYSGFAAFFILNTLRPFVSQ